MQKQHCHLLSVEMQWNKAQWNLNPLIPCIQKQLNSSGRKGRRWPQRLLCANTVICIITYFHTCSKRVEVNSLQGPGYSYVMYMYYLWLLWKLNQETEEWKKRKKIKDINKNTNKKTPNIFLLLELQITSRVSWCKSWATQWRKPVIHNNKTFNEVVTWKYCKLCMIAV